MTLRRAAAMLGLALLAGCSATKLVYNHLDWVASMRVGKYVDLEGPSKVLFHRGFESLWQWHRGTQLSLYARDLRELAAAAQQPLSREQVGAYLKRASQHATRLFDEALPASAQVFAAMDDAETRELVANINEERDERIAEDAAMTPEDLRRRDAKDMAKSLKRWLGPLDDAQRQRIEAWSHQRHYDHALAQAYYGHWMQQFQDTLDARARPEFPARFRALFAEPDVAERAAFQAQREFNNQQWIALMSDLTQTLSAAQRQHFQHELRDLAADLDALATDTRQAALPGRIG